MNIAPKTVTTYLELLDSPCELTGYLCLHDDEQIVISAGKIGGVDLSQLDKTKSVFVSVPFLEGLLLTKIDSVTVIRNVHIDDKNYFDIHLFYDDLGYWVLFVDATLSGKQLQEEQQVRLDVDFINEKRKAGN